jgi:flagellin
LERLSSGLRINRAGDDAAGLAIATKLNAQVRGLTQAARNVNNAISLVQTAEGALNTITNLSQRLRELAVQAASDDNTTTDRQTLQNEAAQLVAELTRTAQTSEFNGSPLLDGSYGNKFFQIGANYSQTLTFSVGDVRAKSLGTRATVKAGNLTDGVHDGIGANIATGELKINGSNVVTSDGDDQLSVVELLSTDVASTAATAAAVGSAGATVINASLIFNNVIQKNDFGDLVSILGTLTATQVAGGASGFQVTASFVIGDSATTISTVAGTSASLAIDLFSSYASIGLTFGATIGAASVVVERSATFTYASINYAASVSGTQFEINGTYVSFTANSESGIASFASYLAKVVSDINAASITNVQAILRSPSSAIARTFVLQATKGANLALKTSGASVATNLFLSATFATSGGTTVIYNGQSSAIGKAAAVNAVRGTTNVTGTANSNVLTGSTAITAVTIRSGDLVINGVDVGAVSVLANDGSGDLVAKLNSLSASSGVTASVNTDNKLVLTATDGRNITIRSTSLIQTALSVGGNNNTNNVQRGSVTLNSPKSITVAGTKVSDLGGDLTVKTYTADLTNKLSLVSLSTQESAAQALLTIDAALDEVNDIRSAIGAIQSRLENTVTNLKIAAENFTASESRIRDADFALETSKFTRNQILVQAGTAILAQANTTSQIALQLLQR